MLNDDRDENFAAYVKSLLDAKRLEVSSTTLPQLSIPVVMGDDRYAGHLARREAMFERRAQEAYDVFKDCEQVIVNKPSGAFYFTVMFKDGVLNDRQTLPIANAAVRKRISEMIKGARPDRRFVYYLMGASGIVVVPLSGFQCDHDGFRMTLLETDDGRRAEILKTIREAIDAYVGSSDQSSSFASGSSSSLT